MITIKQLRYALAVEKTLHFKRASELCHISQSTLSTALNELETQLGEMLFERDNKKVLVTPVGEKVLDHARKIIDLVTELEEITSPEREPLSHPIKVGMIPTIAPYLLPELLPILIRDYPEAQLTVVEEQSHRVVELVKKGEIDTAILALPYDCEGLLTLEFWKEDFYWITLKSRETRTVKKIRSRDIDQSSLMLLNEGHCLKDHILDACHFSHLSDRDSFGATSLTTIVQMVIGGLGTTLIPEMSLKTLTSNNKQLQSIPLNERSPHRKIAFIIRPNYTRMACIEALMTLCKESLS